jgi:hypothetical protein
LYVIFPYGFWKFNGHTEWKAYLSFVAKKLVRGWLLLALMILKNSQYYSPKYILKAKTKIQVQCFFLGMYVCMYVCMYIYFASSFFSLLELQKNNQMQSASLMKPHSFMKYQTSSDQTSKSSLLLPVSVTPIVEVFIPRLAFNRQNFLIYRTWLQDIQVWLVCLKYDTCPTLINTCRESLLTWHSLIGSKNI